LCEFFVVPASPAKLAAARRNGQKGGAPRKTLNKLKIVEALASQGSTMAEVSRTLGVGRDTLWRWMKEDRRLSNAYKRGGAMRDRRIVDALADKALGMVLPDCHVSQHQGIVTVTPLEKHLAPDTLAQIFWLKNRDPQHWNDRQITTVEHSIAGVSPDVIARMKALGRAKAAGKPMIEVQEVKALPAPAPAKEAYWNYDGL
jgi:hypothetical protein